MGPVLSIVAPAYNEERNLPAFLGAIIPVLEGIGETFEIIFVNDGSRDGTLGMLAAAASQDPRIKVVGLARNFGKDIALSAGLSHASGQAVIPIDCDLQHPVELIPAFVAKWREGYDMVIGVRSRRDEEGYVRRTLSRTYYRVMKFMTSVEIPPNAGDFRLLDRKILDVINKMPERHRFMKGIFAWPGFKVASIEFQANVRANETRSTWSFFKLWRFALDGLFSFSTAPLKLWTYIGALSAGGAFLYLLITIIQKLFWGIAVPGYASLLIVLLFFNGLLLISNGIQGEYIARIFEEVKGRPLYVVGETFGFPDSVAPRAGVVARPLPALQTAPHVAPPPPNDSNATQIGIPSAPIAANAPLAGAASPGSGAQPVPETRPLRPAKPTQPPAAGALGPSAFAGIGTSPSSPSASIAAQPASPRLSSAPIIGSASPSSARRPHSPSQAGTPRPHSPSQQPLPFAGDAPPFAPSQPAGAHSPSSAAGTHASPAAGTHGPSPAAGTASQHAGAHAPAGTHGPSPAAGTASQHAGAHTAGTHAPSQAGTPQPAVAHGPNAQPFAPSAPSQPAHAQPFSPSASSQPAHAQPFAPSPPSQPAHAQPSAHVQPSAHSQPTAKVSNATGPKRALSDAWDESAVAPHTPATRAPSSPPVASTRAPTSPPVAASTRAPSSPPVGTGRAPSSPPIATEAAPTDAAAGATPPPTPPARPKRELPKPTKGPIVPR